jgi:hypothetical protein
MTEAHLAEIAEAKRRLEAPSLVVRLSTTLGTPIENALARLPPGTNEAIHRAATKALERTAEVALSTLRNDRAPPANDLHRALAAAAGGIGGAFGLAALAVELPVSTGIIFRSIADHARAQGFDPAAAPTRVECLSVFAMGGTSRSDDAAESAYFATRVALAQAVATATRVVAAGGARALGAEGASAIARLIAAVAERFSAQVAQKAIAQAIPAIGALGGAAVNTAFVAHFQNVAAGHFAMKRLEGLYGVDAVWEAYKGA